ncbi:MAG: efflux transporter outer membrane subunit [Verrucomicrobiota bacterium]
MKKLIATSGFTLLLLSGCKTIGEPSAAPKIDLPEQFINRESISESDRYDLVEWWTLLQDDQLSRLVDRAAKNNRDLQAAAARVEQAKAARKAAAGNRLPSLGIGLAYTDQEGSLNGPGAAPPLAAAGLTSLRQSDYEVGSDLEWEIDLFGSVRAAVRRAQEDQAFAEEAKRLATLQIVSGVAQGYLTIRGLQERLQVAEDNARTQEQTLQFVQDRKASGFASRLEEAQALSQWQATRSAIPVIQAQIEQRIYQLATLVGERPDQLAVELSATRPLPGFSFSGISAVPTEVIRRRPDFRMAERQLARASADIAAAVAERYPKLILFGGIAQQSLELDSLFDSSSQAWSFRPSLSLPLFTGGKIQAGIDAAQARNAEAVALFENTVLSILSQIESSIVAYQQGQEEIDHLRDSVEAAREAVSLAESLYQEGLVDFLNVLESESRVLDLEDRLVASRINLALNGARLFEALGGGWEKYEQNGENSVISSNS